jgi:signal peptidase
MTLITLSNRSGEKSLLISKRGMLEVNPDLYVLAPKERVVQTQSRIKRVFRVIGLVLAWLLTAVLLTFVTLDLTGVIQARIVATGSMAPAINPGDVVLTMSPDNVMPVKGRIVTYQGRRLDGTPVALFSHRVIGGNAQDGFVVKGDANPSADTQKPTIKDILGVVVLTIPWVGHLLDPKILVLALLGLFGLWLIWDAFREEE